MGLLALSALGIAQIRIDTSTNSFLDRSDPAWEAYQRSLVHYGGDELLVVALQAETPWDPGVVAELVRLSETLAHIPGVRRVDSLATVPLIRSEEGTLRLDAGLSDGIPRTQREWQRYQDWVRADPIARRSLASDDGRVFALNVLLDEKIVTDRLGVVAAVRTELGDLPASVTGVPVFRTAVNSRTLEQVLVFVPLTLFLLGGVLVLSLGGGQGVVVAFSVGGLGAASALGAMGVVGVPLSLTTTMLPSLVVALGCAYSMHVLTAARSPRSVGALRASLVPVLRPIGLSGLTTVIGFLAMATVPVAAIRELATYGALGVFVATLAVLSLAPAVLALWPMGDRTTPLDRLIRGRLRESLGDLVRRRRGSVVVGWALVAVLAGSGLTQLFYATDIIQWFPRGSDVREEYESVREMLSGITPVNVVVHPWNASGESDVTYPESLHALDRLTLALAEREEVGKALSVTDPLRQIHRVMAGDSSADTPLDRALVSQYLLLLESVDRIRDVLRSDHASANILLRLDDNRSSKIVALAGWIEAWWAQHGVPDYSVTTTGIMYEFARAEEEIARGQVRGLLLAFSVVGFVLFLVFRDPRMALLGLGVNAIPLGVIFGGLGFAGVGLDAATACIGSTALGIGVDDTIHVLSGYRERREAGLGAQDAVEGCLERVLPALVFTTLTVAIGFLVLTLSPFTLVVNLGWVTAAIVVLCLLADTTLLPALLLGSWGRTSSLADGPSDRARPPSGA